MLLEVFEQSNAVLLGDVCFEHFSLPLNYAKFSDQLQVLMIFEVIHVRKRCSDYE